jgi:hypothetical protein
MEFWTSGAPLCPPQRKEIVIPFAAANSTYTNAWYQLYSPTERENEE